MCYALTRRVQNKARNCVCPNHQCFGQHFGHFWIGVLNIAGILLSNALPANTCCFRMHSKHMWWFIVAQIIMFVPWNFFFFQIMVVATVEKSIQQLLCQSCCNFLCAGQISDLHQWVFDAMNDEFLCRLSTPTCWTQIVDSAHLIRQNLFSMIFLLWQHTGTSTNKCNYLIFGWNYCSILYLQHVGTHKLNWRSVLILELIFFEWKNMEHTIWNLWVRGGWINKAAIRCAPAWTLWFVWALVGPDKKLVNVCKSRLQLLRTSNTFYACGVSQVALDPCFFSMWCLVM